MASLEGQAGVWHTHADLSLSTSRLCSSSGPGPGCHRGLSALSGPREGSSSCPSKTSLLSWSHPVCLWGFGTSGEGRKDSLSGGGKMTSEAFGWEEPRARKTPVRVHTGLKSELCLLPDGDFLCLKLYTPPTSRGFCECPVSPRATL